MSRLRSWLTLGAVGVLASCGPSVRTGARQVVPPPPPPPATTGTQGAQSGATPDTTLPLLTLREARHGGGDRSLAVDGGAVDINSTVLVTLNRQALRARAVGASAPAQIFEDLAVITGVLNGLADAINTHQAALTRLAARPDDTQALTDAINTATAVAAPLDEINELAVLRPVLLEILMRRQRAVDTTGTTSIEMDRAAAEAATEYLNLLQGQVDSIARQNGVRVRMGAFLVRGNGAEVPLHLRGFDTIAPQQTLIIPQYQLFLSQAQLEELKRAQEAASRTREAIAAGESISPLTELRAYARGLFRVDLTCVANLQQQVSGLPATLQPPRDALLTAVQDFTSLWERLRTKYTQTGGTDLLAGTQSDLLDLRRRASAVVTALDALKSAGAAAGGTAAALVGSLQSCTTTLQKDVLSVLDQALDGAGLGEASRNLANATLDFSDKVLSLDLASVPASTEVVLPQAGPREAGDQVVLRLATYRGNAEVYSERRAIPMQRIVPHLELAVSMIWMERGQLPDNDESGRWHPAASYSIVAKRFMPWEKIWARRSAFYAQVFDPGLGINLSAPDFDHDDTPEFAIGPVISVFRDYLQGGYSYNFQESQWTWFVGIRLPIPSATIPVVESSGQP